MTDSGPKTPATGAVPPPLPPVVQTTATQPFSPAPSVATSAQVTELAKLINRKLDNHADDVSGQLGAFHKELALLRVQNADTLPPPPPDKGALAVAATHTWTVAKVVFIATGALGFAMQVAAAFKPSLVGPLQHAIQFLNALGGG